MSLFLLERLFSPSWEYPWTVSLHSALQQWIKDDHRDPSVYDMTENKKDTQKVLP